METTPTKNKFLIPIILVVLIVAFLMWTRWSTSHMVVPANTPTAATTSNVIPQEDTTLENDLQLSETSNSEIELKAIDNEFLQ